MKKEILRTLVWASGIAWAISIPLNSCLITEGSMAANAILGLLWVILLITYQHIYPPSK